nr:FAD-dependent oxidoreductase [Paenibacillus senegalensis]
MRKETVRTDITVVGGGLAGVCAAVAAARLGCKVALVQNRPVLGGNSSSEVRVWVCGATAHGIHRFARETGIMGELFVENQYTNPEGNPYYWDLVVLEQVKAEPNIQLFLNTDVHELEADGPEEQRTIRSVTGWMMGSERRIEFRSSYYLDCTGDGLIGYLAGAKYRIGREARNEYNEDWAPDTADSITLGSTLLFYTKDHGAPVKFVPPSFALNIADTSIPLQRVIKSGDNGCAYWWIEWGGELDIVDQNERIRDELWSVIYGIWDYIKNSGQFDADTMTLEWVGSIPGKREYRRFVGDYELNQNDLLAQKPFHDRVAFGGWSIDLHPPQGVYAKERGSNHLHLDGIYHIPFRSLYSINVSNMLMAGRNISASHVAFGTTRVMATCAVIGEAAGTGAALAAHKGISPRELGERHIEELQQLLLHQDASVIGLAHHDPANLARQARVRASSRCRHIAIEEPVCAYPLTADTGLLFPVDPRVAGVELLLDAADDTVLEVELCGTGRAENYVPAESVDSCLVKVARGEQQWVALELNWEPQTAQNAFLIIRSNPAITLYQSEGLFSGVLMFARRPLAGRQLEAGHPQPAVEWDMRRQSRFPLCFRMRAETKAYNEGCVTDGILRPYGGPHSWMSAVMKEDRQPWLELSWPEAVVIRELHCIFNDDVNEDLINLHHHRTPFDVIPELVRDYRWEGLSGGEWQEIARMKGNRKRKQIHKLGRGIPVEAVRLVVEATNGSPRAEVIEIRAYG